MSTPGQTSSSALQRIGSRLNASQQYLADKSPLQVAMARSQLAVANTMDLVGSGYRHPVTAMAGGAALGVLRGVFFSCALLLTVAALQIAVAPALLLGVMAAGTLALTVYTATQRYNRTIESGMHLKWSEKADALAQRCGALPPAPEKSAAAQHDAEHEAPSPKKHWVERVTGQKLNAESLVR